MKNLHYYDIRCIFAPNNRAVFDLDETITSNIK